MGTHPKALFPDSVTGSLELPRDQSFAGVTKDVSILYLRAETLETGQVCLPQRPRNFKKNPTLTLYWCYRALKHTKQIRSLSLETAFSILGLGNKAQSLSNLRR